MIPFGRSMAVTVAVLGLLAPPVAAKARVPPCLGRYVVRDAAAPLFEGGDPTTLEAVVLAATGVRVESGCASAPTTSRSRKKGGWMVHATFPPCRGLGRMKIALAVSADCEVIQGRLRGRRRMRKDFAATPTACGDGVVDASATEECEPPGTSTCDLRCRRLHPLPARCGDGHVDAESGEECDDGNAIDGDGCHADCRLPRCGDGVKDPGEQCDDGNAADADGCSSTCIETCEGQDTLLVIQDRVFTPTCALAGCHGAFPQVNLDLRPGTARVSLVDVLAENAAARAAGKLRVVPGDPGASFLSQNIHAALAAGEGDPMPLFGLPLSAPELQAIDAWIAAGAPATGVAAGAPCLPRPGYVPAPPLPVPPGGFQVVLDGPTLLPHEEQEGCLWLPVPNDTDFYAGRFEFSLNPGTHHYAIFEYQAAGAPETGVWELNNFGCVNGAGIGGSIAGAPYAPYFQQTNPPGVARRIAAGSYIGLNAHYHNEFDVPIQIKVWSNFYPYVGTPEHVAKSIQDLSSTFTINVAPYTQAIHPGRFTNTSGVPMSIYSVAGHMHFRGLRFTIWKMDGTKIYESFDWAHPGGRTFEPPFVLEPGDWFDYECLYDNGVTRPVRRDDAGNPRNLTFGVSTEDAMCVLVGAYYDD